MQSCTVNKSFVAHPITLLLRRQAVPIVETDQIFFDYKCNTTGVLVTSSANLLGDDAKKRLINRTKTLFSHFKSQSAIIIRMEGDPDVQLLSFLNIDITIGLRVKVVLCGGFDQAASFLNGLCNVQYSSRNAHVPTFRKTDVPFEILIQCFSEVSSILQKPDVIRIANKTKRVSQFLQCTDEDIGHLPGIGEKKKRRLLTLLRAPFVSSFTEIEGTEDVEPSSNADSTGHEKMKDVLSRFLDAEIGESDE